MKIDIDALRQIERDKAIDFNTVVEAFESAVASAYKRSNLSSADEARVVVDRISGEMTIYGQELDDEGAILSEWVEDVDPRALGRIVAQTAKQVLLQRLREAEREATYGEYSGREGDVVSGRVSLQGNVTLLELGRTEALLPFAEQLPNERLEHGEHTRALVIEVRRQLRGAQIVCSRRHPGLVVALFSLEVPEIEDGTVEIRAIAREAGHRTKVAVMSNEPDVVDPVGACVGPRGQRAQAVQRELHKDETERIDIIRYSDDPEQFVANALSPAKVTQVYLYPDEGTAMVIVPDHMLSLAIGREGQNARLAARLTGWRIDIKSESQFEEEQKAFQQAFDQGLVDEFGNPLSEEGEAAIAKAFQSSEQVLEAALEEADEEEGGGTDMAPAADTTPPADGATDDVPTSEDDDVADAADVVDALDAAPGNRPEEPSGADREGTPVPSTSEG